jgi:hypothetical protein
MPAMINGVAANSLTLRGRCGCRLSPAEGIRDKADTGLPLFPERPAHG